MLLDSLMTMEGAGVSGTACECIRGWKHMFTAFTFSMTGSRNIHWMPLQLALAVVGMSMESANHQAQV